MVARPTTVSAVVLTGLVLAGCGQDPSGVSSSSVAVTGPGSPSGATVSGSALGARAYDSLKKNRSYRMVTHVLAGGRDQVAQYDIALSQDRPVIATTVQTSQGAVDLITDTQRSYGRSKAFGMNRWVRVTTDSKRPGITALAAGMNTVIAAADPRSSSDVLKAVPSFTSGGRQPVNGVETTRYRGAVPAAAVAKLMPDLATLVKGPSPMEVWVASDGAVHKVVLDLPVTGSRIRYTQNFTEQGRVKVTMPQGDEIAQEG